MKHVTMSLVLSLMFAFVLFGCELQQSAGNSGDSELSFSDTSIRSSVAGTTTYQAESQTLSNCAVSTAYTGYTGTGYVSGTAQDGYILFTVTVPSTASYSVVFTYSNLTGSTRSVKIYTNGSDSGTVYKFPNTSAWTVWSTYTATLALNAGSTTIKVKANTSSGMPNIDKMDLQDGSSATASPSASAVATASATASATATAVATAATGDITVSTATELKAAIISIAAGKTIWLKDGTYSFSAPFIIAEGNSGSSGSYKTIKAINTKKAILDFSGESVSDSNRGVILAGSYWSFYGVIIQKAGDNGMLIAGHYNTIDYCTFYQNSDAGCQISRYNTSYTTIDKWPHNNTVSNCESYDNYDAANGGENADGFAAKLTCGNGNKFTSCYSHGNSDDGWDLYTKTDTGAIGIITFTSCTAEKNGYLYRTGKVTTNGDGNGFKLGDDAASVAHILTNCISNYNLGYGYTGNGNPAVFKVTNCTGTGNVKGLADRMNGSM